MLIGASRPRGPPNKPRLTTVPRRRRFRHVIQPSSWTCLITKFISHSPFHLSSAVLETPTGSPFCNTFACSHFQPIASRSRVSGLLHAVEQPVNTTALSLRRKGRDFAAEKKLRPPFTAQGCSRSKAAEFAALAPFCATSTAARSCPRASWAQERSCILYQPPTLKVHVPTLITPPLLHPSLLIMFYPPCRRRWRAESLYGLSPSARRHNACLSRPDDESQGLRPHRLPSTDAHIPLRPCAFADVPSPPHHTARLDHHLS